MSAGTLNFSGVIRSPSWERDALPPTGIKWVNFIAEFPMATEFGREVLGVPGNATEPSSFGPNQLIKQGAKLVTGWEDVTEEPPRSIRAEIVPVEAATREERTVSIRDALGPSERQIYDLLSTDEATYVDDLVEKSCLTSSERLAALFDLELKGVVRQLPGKQFLKVLL